MKTSFLARNTDQLTPIARDILKEIPHGAVIALYGEMGAGKTTFVHALCDEMGIQGAINSPTFSIINEYEVENGELVYHFDFYRINSVEEAYDFGYEEYFNSGYYCFIEWPELVESLLPPQVIRINIEVLPDETRKITLTQTHETP